LFVPESIFNDRKKKQGEEERFPRRERKNGELINLNIVREGAAIDFNKLRIQKVKKDPPNFADYAS